MKKYIFALFIALLSVGQVFGLSYYAKGTAKIHTDSPDGSGKVYVQHVNKGSAAPTPPADTDYKNTDYSDQIDDKGKTYDFYFYAMPSSADYQFEAWYGESGDKLSNDTPYKTPITAPTTSGTKEVVLSAKFRMAPKDVNITYNATEHGSYTYKYDNHNAVEVAGNAITDHCAELVTLTANAADGYRFLGWYKIVNNEKKYFSIENPICDLTLFETQTIGVDFIEDYKPTFINRKDKETLYTDLATAFAAAEDNDVIVLVADGELREDVEIPANKTLLIPFNKQYVGEDDLPLVHHKHQPLDGVSTSDYSTDRSSVFRMLTIAAGVKLTVNGKLSLGAWRWTTVDSGSNGSGMTNISGECRIDQGYGLITMLANTDNQNNTTKSQIIVNGKLYCFGRIRGDGEIIAESGSEVRECFVYTDCRESNAYKDIADKTKCFTMNQYYVQDIQVSIKYKYGSKCTLVSGLFSGSGSPGYSGTMGFVGATSSNSLFELPNVNSTISKRYDVDHDRLIIDLENGASFNNFTLTFKYNSTTYKYTTETHIFTITNNWTINVNSGTTNIAHDIALAAGAKLNIKPNAHVIVNSGASLYAYAKADWGLFASKKNIIPLSLPSYELTTMSPDYYTLHSISLSEGQRRNTSEKYKVIRTYDNLEDAAICVDGKLTLKGGQNTIYTNSYGGKITPNDKSGLYTSSSKANIFSTKNGGEIIYENGAGTQEVLPTLWGSGTKSTGSGTGNTQCTNVEITPAQLKNADGVEPSYTSTAGASGMSTFKYFSEDGKWKKVSKVTFKDDGTTIKEDSVAQGDEIIPPTEELPTKAGHKLTGWSNISDPMGTTDIISEAQWEQIKIKASTIEVTPTKVITNDTTETSITENNTYTINEQVIADTVQVDEGATIEITEKASVETQTLALSTTPSAINLPDEGQSAIGTSSQIKGKGAINAQNVFIDITMDTSGTLDASKYYAFAVPFAVKVDGGVQQFNDNEWVDCKHDTHYRAYTYDGAKRADNGKGSNWTLVDNNGTFQPGVFYLVEFAPGMGNVYRFTKAEGNLNNAADINLKAFASANTTDKGWNGIANNALQNVSISLSGTGVAQIFNPVKNAFVTVGLEGTQFAIGTPLFVQVENDATATNSAVSQPTSAPAQILAQPQTETLGNYIVRIAAENADKMADQLFISASEDAENNYVIGKDLVKMFMGNATTAQLWANNYDKKLSMHQALLTNGSAEASLTLFAPKAGNYRIYLKETPEDATIYLLENGYVVANLNDDAYYVALTKGENSLYGLRINAKTKSDVTTSINDVKATSPVQKVLFQNKVYIVRNGRLFDIFGQTVK